MRPLACAIVLWVSALPAWADARITVLMDLLHIHDVVSILRTEGLEYGADLDRDMLDSKGGAFWAGQVGSIYDPGRMQETLRRALESGMSDSDIDSAIAYFSTSEGQSIVELENAARGLMSDPDVEAAARGAYHGLNGSDDPLLGLVTRYVTVNDLVERNVTSAMTSTARFYTGLSDGGYYKRSEADILEEVWTDQDDIRIDTESWLYGFLLMAYEPVPVEAMRDYVDYADSASGRKLNAALFDGFEVIFSDISYALGRAIALNAQGDEI